MTITKKITTTLLWAVLMLPVALYSQAPEVALSGKWDFASAQVVEKDRQTGMVYAGKTFFSVNEIENKVHFSYAPVQIEFLGNGESVNVRQMHGAIGAARATLNGETLTLTQLRGSNAAFSQEEITAADPADFYVAAQYEKFRLEEKTLSLQYTYIYMVSGKDIIDGVMTITFKPAQAKPEQVKSEQIKTEQNPSATVNEAPQRPNAGMATAPQRQGLFSNGAKSDKDGKSENGLLNSFRERAKSIQTDKQVVK